MKRRWLDIQAACVIGKQWCRYDNDDDDDGGDKTDRKAQRLYSFTYIICLDSWIVCNNDDNEADDHDSGTKSNETTCFECILLWLWYTSHVMIWYNVHNNNDGCSLLVIQPHISYQTLLFHCSHCVSSIYAEVYLVWPQFLPALKKHWWLNKVLNISGNVYACSGIFTISSRNDTQFESRHTVTKQTTILFYCSLDFYSGRNKISLDRFWIERRNIEKQIAKIHEYIACFAINSHDDAARKTLKIQNLYQ